MHILLVEDNAALASLFEVQLEQLGHDLTIAGTKAQALAVFSNETFDLVFIDMGLEGERDRGLEILTEMKTLAPGQRIGMLCSNDLPNMVQRSRAGGAEFYIVKPFTLEGLNLVLSGNKEAIKNYQPEVGIGQIISFDTTTL